MPPLFAGLPGWSYAIQSQLACQTPVANDPLLLSLVFVNAFGMSKLTLYMTKAIK